MASYYADRIMPWPRGDDYTRAYQCLVDLWCYLEERNKKRHLKKCPYKTSRTYNLKLCICGRMRGGV